MIYYAAFQIMNLLLNYQRAVQDFGRCDTTGRVLYDLTLVAKCVGMQPHTCKDTR